MDAMEAEVAQYLAEHHKMIIQQNTNFPLIHIMIYKNVSITKLLPCNTNWINSLHILLHQSKDIFSASLHQSKAMLKVTGLVTSLFVWKRPEWVMQLQGSSSNGKPLTSTAQLMCKSHLTGREVCTHWSEYSSGY